MGPFRITNEENLRKRLKALEVDIERYTEDSKSDNWEIAHGSELFLKAARHQRDLIRAILSPHTT